MIKIPSFAGSRFVILGLRKSGLATAACLKRSGAEFILWDDKESARDKALQAGYEVKNPMTVNLSGYSALVLSPGIPLTYPTPHPVVVKCRNNGIPIVGENDLLFQACPDATYIGITGTNGKSTTTALIAHILESSGRNVQVGGNLGTPSLALKPLGSDGFYVLETSSFQLDLMNENLFKVAIILNITPDHFDRHGDMNGYIAAKHKIINVSAAQTLIIGIDEPETQSLAQEAKRQPNLHVEEISINQRVNRGVILKNGFLVACNKKKTERILNMSEAPRLPGAHNAQNACAAYAACKAIGLSDAEIISGIKSFPGLAHRQQLVDEMNGVRFINDSKATNADAASKALGCYKNIYWIVGGKPKVGGLDGLESFMPSIRHAFLIGVAAKDFAKWLDGKCAYTQSGTMDMAVKQAAEMAWKENLPGATVLLSPACASFDQFSGFEERGDKFVSFVKDLKDKSSS
ncbi:MAG: UDP-N-acetylmuramoyl-L-alanine--D-glutamate ligase [Alphaproteobacteria bacterium]|nr:UDP-N-acetylmuramoyl-L-alanine--D-glutamate ligase [Alphaproteobacteria bacterium]